MKTAYRNKQQGVVLVIALIALVAISLAGVALMRTVDTSNVVSGNIAFNETAIQMADIGAEQAYVAIENNKSIVLNPTLANSYQKNLSSCINSSANCPKNSAGNSYYYPNFSVIDAVSRLPTPTGGLFWSDKKEVLLPGEATGNGTFFVQYVIERMCTGTGVGNQYSQSSADQAIFGTSQSQSCTAIPLFDYAGSAVLPWDTTVTPNTPLPNGKLYFRITVQVTGPRNTTALSQYFYGVPEQIL